MKKQKNYSIARLDGEEVKVPGIAPECLDCLIEDCPESELSIETFDGQRTTAQIRNLIFEV